MCGCVLRLRHEAGARRRAEAVDVVVRELRPTAMQRIDMWGAWLRVRPVVVAYIGETSVAATQLFIRRAQRVRRPSGLVPFARSRYACMCPTLLTGHQPGSRRYAASVLRPPTLRLTGGTG